MYDIAIIGAGPGGYVAAIRAAQLGAKVALIEKEEVGGVCLNWGCIPTKTLLYCVEKYNEAKKLAKYGVNADSISYDYIKIFNKKQQTVEKIVKSLTRLIKSKNIELIKGEAVIESSNSLKVKDEVIEFKNLIIATGSRPASLPRLEIDHRRVLDSKDILALEELPDSILIVGSGAIGLEWARILSGLEKKVEIVEIADRLCPMLDGEVSAYVEKLMRRMKITVHKGTRVQDVKSEADIILLAAGRKPNIDIKGIENIDQDKTYFVGDVTGKCMLAHVASHQGVKTVEHILSGKEINIKYNHVPSIIYGKPEIAMVGFTEEALIEKGIEYKKSYFPMSALGRAQAEDKIEGFVKVLANEKEILGVHIIGEYAGELIQQAVIAMSNENPTEIVFPHPTYSEAIYEAFLGVYTESLHL